ncbi:M28 family peptidase [Candidatus Marinimicrobia bacterium MT.SAG.4]|nr:M28 family peptidase [Candidatus Marinimicrobia bacterium MT.SAG.4]
MDIIKYFLTATVLLSFMSSCAQTKKAPSTDSTTSMNDTRSLLGDAFKAISEEEIKMHLKYLSDDKLQGRAPGSEGIDMAAEYIASQFEEYGLEPAVDGSFYQEFSMVGVELTGDNSIAFTKDGKSVQLEYFVDYMKETGLQVEHVEVDAELVYVGYGIQAPENDWDDYKGVDVTGKVLLILVNDPPSDDPNHFGGEALTYYGRWTYKYEKAAEMGAVGAILIHTDESAGYGWKVITGSWSGEQSALGLNENSPPQLSLRSWLSADAAEKLFSSTGFTLSDMQEKAARQDFTPIPTGINVKTTIKSKIRTIKTKNVIGIIRGTDPLLSHEMILWTGHYDHLGIGAANSEGDSIYNGAWDNASGISAILIMAKVAVKLKYDLRRSILVMALTAEESGLLGSKYYSENPVYHLATAKALFNIDAINLWGETTDLIPLGYKRSTMEAFLAQIAKNYRITLKPDQSPGKGFYFRSDHFPFAKAGVPAVSIDSGNDYVGRDQEWKESTVDAWIDANYHQPSDEYDENWDYSGVVQLARFVLHVTYNIASADSTPEWNDGQEFKEARLKSLEEYRNLE